MWAAVLGIMQGGRTVTVDGGACDWGRKLDCSLSAGISTALKLRYICVGVYFALYAWYLRRAWVQLRT